MVKGINKFIEPRAVPLGAHGMPFRASYYNLAFLAAASVGIMWYGNKYVNARIYGVHGRGGSMLNVYSELSDEEMEALQRYNRNLYHLNFVQNPSIVKDESLIDRGIEIPQRGANPTAEAKKYPHRKYI
mmetsp:Transcript_755/g.791  ORF Transcript_755/g.791 Transcript_755/m.791 type:complete len:129 (-) Transcript_755:307-693(-)